MNPKALTRAATVTIAWIGAVTVHSEMSSTYKELLTLIGGHHWIGKSVLSIFLFAVLYFLFAKFGNDEFTLNDLWWLIGVTIVSGLAIVIFYILHFLG